jgi:hypothetical protein
MKRIILNIQRLLSKSHNKPPPLGRWNIEICNKKLNNKIDLANEDHCGTCGKYLNNILNKNTKKINK